MDNKAILYVIGIFFAIGGIDYLIGNRLKLGNVFVETLQKMGMILLGVMGIYPWRRWRQSTSARR